MDIYIYIIYTCIDLYVAITIAKGSELTENINTSHFFYVLKHIIHNILLDYIDGNTVL